MCLQYNLYGTVLLHMGDLGDFVVAAISISISISIGGRVPIQKATTLGRPLQYEYGLQSLGETYIRVLPFGA